MYTTCCLSDTTICQNLVYISHRAKTILPYLNSYIILIWRSKYKVIQRSWLYTRHHTMVIYLSAKHNMTMSKDKKAVVQTQSHVINPIHLTLRSKDVVSGSRMLAIHPLMVTEACAKYGQTWKHVKYPLKLTLRSKVNVILGSWMYATHCLIVIHPCATYGKPLSNKKKSYRPGTNLQTDGQTDRDRQSDSYKPPWNSFTVGIPIPHYQQCRKLYQDSCCWRLFTIRVNNISQF